MGWIAREIAVASGVGAVVAAVETARADEVGLAPLALPMGLVAGAVVGGVSALGGTLAVRSAQAWPPRSARCWRQRFATCSAAAVFLFVAMVFVWFVSASLGSGDASSPGGAWFLAVSAVCAAVTYACTIFLAPPADVSVRRGE